jgi:hypothetical protein
MPLISRELEFKCKSLVRVGDSVLVAGMINVDFPPVLMKNGFYILSLSKRYWLNWIKVCLMCKEVYSSKFVHPLLVKNLV